MGKRSAEELAGDPADVAFFEKLLDAHRTRAFIRFMRLLPSDPRCRVCRAPFGGRAGRMMRRFGRGPSRKNPTMCSSCFEHAPMGGVQLEIGVLFADVRGFTALAENMAPDDVAKLLNRFYAAASPVLTRSGIVDKMVGDEVMALYLPRLIGEDWVDDVVRDAADLLTAVGYGTPEGAWLPLGVGIDIGQAFVGNVGAGEVKDFTALGDVVNTASRLQSAAAAGQIVMSERLFDRLTTPPPDAAPASLDLKGKQEPEPARILDLHPNT
jgi:adenylate cyclase